MFPDLPTCSPFANRNGMLQTRSAATLCHCHLRAFIPKWSFRPWNMPQTRYQMCHFEPRLSLSAFSVLELRCIFSLSIFHFKNLLLQEVTFCQIMSRTQFLGYTMPHAKQEPSGERKRLRLSEVRGFWPSNIVFTVTPPGKKYDTGLQMGAEREERGQIASQCSELQVWMSPTLIYMRVCFSHATRH